MSADASPTKPQTTALSGSVAYRLEGEVAVITLDDGKANALSHAVVDALGSLLDRAESEAGAVVIVGGAKAFSAGFDLATMTESPESMRDLVSAGARLFMRIYGSPLPTVAACTGHALAAGALVLLSCDERIGPTRPVKIGLNEVAIGMPLPVFAVELARDRLAPAHVGRATIGARIHDPIGAVTAGYLDRTVDDDLVVTEAITTARELSALRRGAYARTKLVLRGRTIDGVLATLDDDLGTVTGPG